MHNDNKGKDILILDKGPTQGLDAETQYSIGFTRPNIKFCLSLHYNRSNRFLFVNATKICQFKAKDFEKKIHLYLGNISGDFSASNMKKAGLHGCMYSFSIAYKAFDTSNIIEIQKYLMKKHDAK